jgi:tRNA(Ile)-lysidine synthase
VLLAVSGGADSTALMVASAALAGPLGLRLEVACVDHGLRPESASEAQAVRAQAEALGLPISISSVSLLVGPGLEARARQARYAALERVREGRGLSQIATAHTADDQAETLLMRLARGAALRGAVGIREVRGRVIRPMLRLRRTDARTFLRTLGVPWREDPMNADPAFLRVRVRTRLLPWMAELTGGDPSAREAAFA